MGTRPKILLLVLLLMIASVSVALAVFHQDPGTGGGSGGCVTSCAKQCPSGYWSSIGCLSGECAYCPCGQVPPMPYCKRPI